MARLWKPEPDALLQPNERVGRRIFDEPKLRGIDQQPEFGGLQISHFREKRDLNVSIDRLGRSSVEPKVTRFLLPRCCWQGGKFQPPKEFDGWAVIKVKDLVNKWTDIPKWEVFPSPVKMTGDEEYSDNPYHAHTVCSSDDNDLTKALFFRHLFERYGEFTHLPTESHKSRVQASGGILGWVMSLSHRTSLWIRAKLSNMR